MTRFKYTNMAALVAFALILMAFVGASSASATVMCKTETDPCTSAYGTGTEIKGSLEGVTKFETAGGEVLDECSASTTEGKVENAGGSTITVTLGIGRSFSICKVLTISVLAGSIELHKIPKTWNFTVTGRLATITLAIFGTSCTYGFGNGVDLGTLTPAKFKFDINKAKMPKAEGGFLCPSEVLWSATYVGTPEPAYAAES